MGLWEHNLYLLEGVFDEFRGHFIFFVVNLLAIVYFSDGSRICFIVVM